MRLDQEVGYGVGALLALQLVTALAAIGLLGRVGPAVEQVLVENVPSLASVEVMLEVLAEPTPDAAARDRYLAALDAARQSVTEAQEPALITVLERSSGLALDGDPAARTQVVSVLGALADVNRASILRSDQAARRLAQTGVWAAVLLGFVSFAVGQLVYRRLRTRLEWPILEVDDALQSVRLGDIHRRCVKLSGPRELERIGHNLNWVLDRTLRAASVEQEERLRAVLLWLLDAQPTATLVLDPREGILAMNQEALRLLDSDAREGDLFDALRVGREPPGWSVETLQHGGLRIATRTGAGSAKGP